MILCVFVCSCVEEEKEDEEEERRKNNNKSKKEGVQTFSTPQPSFPLLLVPFFHSLLSVTVPCNYTPIECTLHKIQSPQNVTIPRSEQPQVYFTIETKFLNDINGINRHVRLLLMFLYCTVSALLFFKKNPGFSC